MDDEVIEGYMGQIIVAISVSVSISYKVIKRAVEERDFSLDSITGS